MRIVYDNARQWAYNNKCNIDFKMMLFYNELAGLPGFAWDSHTTIMSICAFHFYIIYFHFFSADHGIPQTFDDILCQLVHTFGNYSRFVNF